MCIFCKIIAGDIPCHRVYEDDKVIAFLDIKPVNPGHVLILPKQHFQNFEEIGDTDLCGLILVAKKIGGALKHKLGIAGYNVAINNDPVAGQIVPHLHIHVIPRHAGDGHVAWPRSEYEPGEAEAMANKIRESL